MTNLGKQQSKNRTKCCPKANSCASQASNKEQLRITVSMADLDQCTNYNDKKEKICGIMKSAIDH